MAANCLEKIRVDILSGKFPDDDTLRRLSNGSLAQKRAEQFLVRYGARLRQLMSSPTLVSAAAVAEVIREADRLSEILPCFCLSRNVSAKTLQKLQKTFAACRFVQKETLAVLLTLLFDELKTHTSANNILNVFRNFIPLETALLQLFSHLSVDSMLLADFELDNETLETLLASRAAALPDLLAESCRLRLFSLTAALLSKSTIPQAIEVTRRATAEFMYSPEDLRDLFKMILQSTEYSEDLIHETFVTKNPNLIRALLEATKTLLGTQEFERLQVFFPLYQTLPEVIQDDTLFSLFFEEASEEESVAVLHAFSFSQVCRILEFGSFETVRKLIQSGVSLENESMFRIFADKNPDTRVLELLETSLRIYDAAKQAGLASATTLRRLQTSCLPSLVRSATFSEPLTEQALLAFLTEPADLPPAPKKLARV